jgi:apolipoprotein N-acyltransferase
MNPTKKLQAIPAGLLALGALGAFQAAFVFPALWWLVLGYLGCLFELRRLSTPRQAFYVGLVIGLGVYVPQMRFLGDIFKAAAIPLWLILSLFHAAFLLVLNRVEVRWGGRVASLLLPVLWCGIEYLRSEVWWLRFAWFTAGECWPPGLAPQVLQRLGIYGLGLGFAYAAGQGAMLLSATDRTSRRRAGLGVLSACAVFAGAALLPSRPDPGAIRPLQVAGLQLEFPALPDLLKNLDALTRSHPEAELLMLSEYSLEGPPPKALKNWCQRNRKWLVVGGKQPIEAPAPEAMAPTVMNPAIGGTNGIARATPLSASGLPWLRSNAPKERFYNTAFVISTNGEVVFQQAKSRPIQFFADGEPAPSQTVWDSPWGKLGIAICYDASYRQVMDGLIRQGAVALLIPTMDVEQWGAHEHQLNARMAVIRAAEYHVPIFRVASSGISQIIDQNSHEAVTAPFPGPGETLVGTLQLPTSGRSIPIDAWLAPACTLTTVALIFGLSVEAGYTRRGAKRASGSHG